MDYYRLLICVADVGLAAVLSLVMGLERSFFHKQAGIRTYTLVGMGSALFTVISKYGFDDILTSHTTGFDGGRVAAQVVTGIGFLGAGLIFVRRDAVRGLTTAAGIWFVAAVGMAAGAGMHLLAVLATVLYLVVMVGIRPLARIMPHARSTVGHFRIRYLDGHGVLRDIMTGLTDHGLSVIDLRVEHHVVVNGSDAQEIVLAAEGDTGSVATFGEALRDIQGVLTVTAL